MPRTATPSLGTVELVLDQHRDGCPKDRVEAFEIDSPKGVMRITRCIECGEEKVSTTPENEEAA